MIHNNARPPADNAAPAALLAPKPIDAHNGLAAHYIPLTAPVATRVPIRVVIPRTDFGHPRNSPSAPPRRAVAQAAEAPMDPEHWPHRRLPAGPAERMVAASPPSAWRIASPSGSTIRSGAHGRPARALPVPDFSNSRTPAKFEHESCVEGRIRPSLATSPLGPLRPLVDSA